MKTVILVRHIKSDWSNLVQDFDRPVREDRKQDARHIAEEILKRKSVPPLIFASPSRRTQQTAEVVCDTWKVPFKNVVLDRRIYDATTQDILQVIQGATDILETVCIVCHSPAIADFVNEYSDSRIDNVPTSGAVSISFDVKSWKDVKEKGKLNWFLSPKEFRKD